jgi:hypothetical protein
MRSTSKIAPPPASAAALKLREPSTYWIEQNEHQEPDEINADKAQADLRRAY